MFDTLMSMPLLSGISRERLAQALSSVKLQFCKYADGESIVSIGDHCDSATLLISGLARVSITDEVSHFELQYTLGAPDALLPEYIFGRAVSQPAEIKAIGEVSVLRIAKTDYLMLLQSDPVFVLNMLNTLSLKSQHAFEGVLAISGSNLARRVALWVTALTPLRATDIRLHCAANISEAFGVEAAVMHSVLTQMQGDGYITSFSDDALTVADRRSILPLLR